MVADGKVYIGTRRGDFWIFAADREKKILFSGNVGGPVSATAIAANNTLYVATMTHLYALGEKKGEAATNSGTSASQGTNTALFETTDVFVSGTDGYFAYRIPAIETAPDGSLLAFAEARKYNLHDPGFEKQEIDLVMKRSTNNGRAWSPTFTIEDAAEHWSAANPATVVDRGTKTIWLFYLRGKPGRNTYTARPGTDDVGTFIRHSKDNGLTWSEPFDLTSVTRDMADSKWRTSVVGPGGGIQSRDGRLAVPVWKFEPWGVFAVVSDDHGKTWKRHQVVPDVSGDECQLVELGDGRWLFDIRQQRGGHRWRSSSNDKGETWSKPRPGENVSPVACAIERYTSADDDLNRLVWTGPKGPQRSNLVVRVSYDEGATFGNERPIYIGPSAYSDLTILKDRTVGVLWERGTNKNYQFISFTRFDGAWLERR
jgi:sialidase-1